MSYLRRRVYAVKIEERYFESSGARLRCVDFGGSGNPVLLLHGLCGRASEWHETAAWLTMSHRVFALDQRAHGCSQKGLPDLSLDAFVLDALETISRLIQEPVILIGQSMGGLVAYQAAIECPDSVRSLVVVEAQAWDSPPTVGVAEWLRSWPVPFPSRTAGSAWFDSQQLVGRVWCQVLEMRHDGWYPEFRLDDMLTIAARTPTDERARWSGLQMPTLLVHGERSVVSSAETMRAMADSIPRGVFVEISEAGHDVHLERPMDWQQALRRFLQ